ncbi:hypothetical protein DFH06DRAFT_1262614 [Mycena polygramma]|nr:hypothetical protein DFH06DRAFT_1262614 [Mycena polygramma]
MAAPELRASGAATHAFDTLDANTSKIYRLTQELHTASADRDYLRAQLLKAYSALGSEKAAREKAEEALRDERARCKILEQRIRKDEDDIHRDRQELVEQMQNINTKIEAMAERRIRGLSGLDSPPHTTASAIAQYQALGDTATAHHDSPRVRPMPSASPTWTPTRMDASRSECTPPRFPFPRPALTAVPAPPPPQLVSAYLARACSSLSTSPPLKRAKTNAGQSPPRPSFNQQAFPAPLPVPMPVAAKPPGRKSKSGVPSGSRRTMVIRPLR